MSIIDRYIVVTLVKITLLTLFSLVTIFSLFTLIDELGSIKHGYGVAQAFYYALLAMPRWAAELFQLTTIIATMIMLGLLINSNELTIIRTSGVSQLKLAWHMCKGALILAFISILISEMIVPHTEKIAQHMRSLTIAGKIPIHTKYGFWTKNGNSFINVRSIPARDKLENIYIYEFDDHHQLKTSTFARHAQYQGQQWLLEDISSTTFTAQGAITEQRDTMMWAPLLTPEVINLLIIKPYLLSFTDLYDHIKYLKANDQNSSIYEKALWLKISNPIIVIIMVLAGTLLVKNYTIRISIARHVFFGCLLGIGFQIISRIISNLGSIYNIHPAISTTLPMWLILIVIIYLLYEPTYKNHRRHLHK